MAERWVRQRREDPYWKAAKRSGFRSRAAYKLQQIASRYGVLRKGAVVVDLGAAPGGWTQVALAEVGESGAVVAVDISRIPPLPGARLVRGDITQAATLDKVQAAVRDARGGESGAADVVLSDMAPNISGVYSVDQARSVVLARTALDVASRLLRPGGYFVVKVFEGEDFSRFIERVREDFRFVKVYNPPASRKQSSEVYIVAMGFHGRGGRRQPGRRSRAEEE